MPIKTENLGPGSLILGTGSPLEVAGQLTSCRLDSAENVTSTDPVPVLSGEEQQGTDKVTHTHTLAGNLFQDYDAPGVVAFSFANAGVWVPCTFIPNSDTGATLAGEVRPIPITVGGDITGTAARRGENPRSDISWAFRPAPGDTVADIFTPNTP